MRLSVVLACCALAGVVAGAALISMWALGLAVIADSVAVGAFALLRDDGRGPQPSVHEFPSPAQILERARRAS